MQPFCYESDVRRTKSFITKLLKAWIDGLNQMNPNYSDEKTFHLEETHGCDPAGSGLLNISTQQLQVPG